MNRSTLVGGTRFVLLRLGWLDDGWVLVFLEGCLDWCFGAICVGLWKWVVDCEWWMAMVLVWRMLDEFGVGGGLESWNWAWIWWILWVGVLGKIWQSNGRKVTMGSYEKCWVFIGTQKIASRLGFTVPRFCCNGHIFSKFLPNRATILVPWRDLGTREQLKIFCQNRATIFLGVTRFWWWSKSCSLTSKSCHDFKYRGTIL